MSWNCWVSTSRQTFVQRVRVDVDVVGDGRGGGPQLALAQQPLAAAVAELGAELAGERATVRLEVELAAPHRHRRAGCRLGLDVLEERTRRTDLDVRHAVEIGEAMGVREHLARRSPAAVAEAERRERPLAPGMLGEALDGAGQLTRKHLGVVRVDGREVGQHA